MDYIFVLVPSDFLLGERHAKATEFAVWVRHVFHIRLALHKVGVLSDSLHVLIHVALWVQLCQESGVYWLLLRLDVL